MSTKHTPRIGDNWPWRVGEYDPAIVGYRILRAGLCMGDVMPAVVLANGMDQNDALERANELVRRWNTQPELLEALIAATERMEAVASGIPVVNRSKGVSQATHVRHMAEHLAQHAKIARAAGAKATNG